MKHTGNFIVRDGKLVPTAELYFKDFIKDYEGKIFIATLKLLNAGSNDQMWAYYHGVLLDFFVPLFREAGFQVSKGAVDWHLQSLFAVGAYETIPAIDGGTRIVPIFEERSKWGKKRLHDYISDCVQFSLDEFSQEAPNVEEYLRNKKEKK